MKLQKGGLSIGILIFLLINMLFTPLVFAQDTTAKSNKIPEGKWALQFEISNNFTLRSFSGSIISFQKMLSTEKAIRVGLSVYSDYSRSKDHQQNLPLKDSNNIQKTDSNQKVNAGDITVEAGISFIRFKKMIDKVHFFYGYGPGLSFSFQQTHSKVHSYSVLSNDSTYLHSNLLSSELTPGLEVHGDLGVEWFFRSNMSLLAEYVPRFGIKYDHYYSRNFDQGTLSKTKHNNLRFNLDSNVHFGLSVYF